jgi:hypothetical protein
MDTQRQDEEHSADTNAHRQRMFGATKASSDKTGNSHNGRDRKSSSHGQSARLSSHTRIVGQRKEKPAKQHSATWRDIKANIARRSAESRCGTLICVDPWHTDLPGYHDRPTSDAFGSTWQPGSAAITISGQRSAARSN